MDIEQVLTRQSRMWRRIGVSLEKAAYVAAKGGLSTRAIVLAKSAEACFWQSTGENEAIDLKDLQQ